MELRGKKVIVTGGVRGLGRAVVEALIAKDALVTVFDINTHGLAELHERYPGVNCSECDVANYEQVVEATTRYHAEFKSADVLINNAGILYSAPLVRISLSGIEKHDVNMWNKTLATNLNSVFYMTACIVEKMITTRTKGVIVNISSVSASGNAGQSAYSAAKAGVNAHPSSGGSSWIHGNRVHKRSVKRGRVAGNHQESAFAQTRQASGNCARRHQRD
jgi:3-oxoacyl-[acyl-carrier protein] reductase